MAANVGLGALIWQSRNFGPIDWIFVGIITLFYDFPTYLHDPLQAAA